MNFTPRSVLIPIIGANKSVGRVARVQADTEPPSRNEAHLIPAIAELADWQLYEAGSVAIGAVRRLNVPHRKFAVVSRYANAANRGNLSVTNGPDIAGLQSSSSKSAELGLALALLMYAAQSGAITIIATGSLSRDSLPKNRTSENVEVTPVEGIGAKLETIGNVLDRTKGGAYPKRVYFFLPDKTVEGSFVVDTYKDQIDDLVDRFSKAELELIVRPVSSLRQAAAILGIQLLEITTADRLVVLLLVGAAVALILVVAGFHWISAPIDVAFADISTGVSEKLAPPLRTRFDPESDRYEILDPCYGDRSLPVYREGETMLIRVSMRDNGFLPLFFGEYRFAVASASEKSGIKVFPETTFAGGSASPFKSQDQESGKNSLSFAVPITGPLEENKIFILVRKLRPFNGEKLRKSLVALTEGAKSNQVINRAVNFLSEQAPGYLDYSFISAREDYVCKN